MDNDRFTILSTSTSFHADGKEIMRLDKTGMIYLGKRIDDAGEAHRAWLDAMAQMARGPNVEIEKKLNDALVEIERLRGIQAGMMDAFDALLTANVGVCNEFQQRVNALAK